MGQDGSDYGMVAQQFDALGQKVGDEILVNQYTSFRQWNNSSANGGLFTDTLSNGDVVVTWYGEGLEDDDGVYARVLSPIATDTPTTIDGDISGSGPEDTPITGTLTATDPDGLTDGTVFSIESGGEATNGTATIDPATGAWTYTPATDFIGSDSFTVTVTDDLGGTTPQVITVTVDKALEFMPTTNQFLVNTTTANWQAWSSTTALNDGGFVVTWSSNGQDGDGYGVFGQRFSATGTPLGDEFQINTTIASDQRLSSTTALNDGGFVVTWSSNGQDGDLYGVFGQRFSAMGTPLGEEFQVNTTIAIAQRDSSTTVLNDGGFVVTWASNGQDGSGWGVFGQRFSATATPLGDEFQINTTTNGEQWYSSSTALNDGGFVVTWSSNAWFSNDQDGDGSGVFGQQFSATGIPLGGEFQINTTTANWQWLSSTTALNDGSFVVTWSSLDQDGSGYGVFGQRFSATGTPLGDEFQINTTTDSHQWSSSATALNDGGFVVTWSSLGQDGSDYGMIAQQFDALGQKVGDEILVNQYTDSTQRNESWANGGLFTDTLSNGDVVVTWYGEGVEDDSGVYARVLSPIVTDTPATIDGDISGSGPEDTSITGTLTATDPEGLTDGTVFSIESSGEATNGTATIAPATGAWTYTPTNDFIGSDSFTVTVTDDLGGTTSQVITVTVDEALEVIEGTEGRDRLLGSPENDRISGKGGNDYLNGRDGDDDIDGGTGSDRIIGGLGADTIDGGEDMDIVDYRLSNAGVIVNLTTGTGTGGHAEGDIMTNVERVYGSAYNDQLTGDDQNNVLIGNGGIDVLNGGDGNDNLQGRSGNDTLNGKGGNDILRGGFGADILNGGNGNDTAYYGFSDAGVSVDLSSEAAASGGEAEGDTFNGIERLYGSVFNDELTGDDQNNTLIGNGGDDILNGQEGNDFLRGGEGADTLNGGDGLDWVDYRMSETGINIDLDHNTALGGDATGDILLEIERVHGSHQNDTVSGDANANLLWGHSGADTLSGGNGNDVLRGDRDADTLTGGGDRDTFVFAFGDSSLSDYDRITDLEIGAGGDRINGPNIVATSDVVQLGNAPSLAETDIQAILTASSFVANGAATFSVGSQTFIALNNNTAGFEANDDLIIEITGFSGSLNSLAIV
ncbi:MAG: Ig-like domain-containing protein [Cyanobacteria bacterium P01_F01_bin.150]